MSSRHIAPITNALGKVEQINGVYYELIAKPGVPQVGVIAQDVEKALPEVVWENTEGYKTVDYSKLTALLIEGMKEQQKTIETLQAGMAELLLRLEAVERK